MLLGIEFRLHNPATASVKRVSPILSQIFRLPWRELRHQSKTESRNKRVEKKSMNNLWAIQKLCHSRGEVGRVIVNYPDGCFETKRLRVSKIVGRRGRRRRTTTSPTLSAFIRPCTKTMRKTYCVSKAFVIIGSKPSSRRHLINFPLTDIERFFFRFGRAL